MFKKFKNFFKKPVSFIFKKKQTLNVLKNLIISVAFNAMFANFSDFWQILGFFRGESILS